MSLIPSSDQGAAGVNYFPSASYATLRNATVIPPIDGSGGTAAFGISNGGITNPPDHAMNVIQYVTAASGGGLVAGAYQVFMYGPDVSGNNIGELFSGIGKGNNYTTLSFNDGGPLDPDRRGSIIGTGAPQVIACPSIVASSVVYLSFVGGTPAAGAVAATIVPNTSFSVTLPAAAAYNYEIVG